MIGSRPRKRPRSVRIFREGPITARILILTEKREQAVAAIEAVGGRPKDRGGYYRQGEFAVLWLSGHTLEFLPPEAIDPDAWGGS